VRTRRWPRAFRPAFRVAPVRNRLKRPLVRLYAQLEQTRDGLLARRMLISADNPAHLRLHQILLFQTPARVLCRAMEYFRLGTDRLLVHVLLYL